MSRYRPLTEVMPDNLHLPMTQSEMIHLGWDQIDILFVTGDAYVDHPAYGVALLGRWLVSKGYRVGIVSQPRWDCIDDIEQMGCPRIFAGITAGALDSMLAHYTAFRKKRSDDANTAGGKSGMRPNRSTIVYTGLVKQAFPGLPVIIGGIEASLRRATHYDFWTDKIRRSILLDSKADLLVYGMGELSILEIAKRLTDVPDENKDPTNVLHGIPGTVFAQKNETGISCSEGSKLTRLPSHQDIMNDPGKLMDATLALEKQIHDGNTWAIQSTGDRELVFTPPSRTLTPKELDHLYELPFTRKAHPSYDNPVPGSQMIQFSITSHRGCGGGCSFCSLALHQGRHIRSRGIGSIRNEALLLTKHPDWKGSISDVGGPSANMWGVQCKSAHQKCRRSSCLYPDICSNFRSNQAKLAKMLQELAELPGIKHLRVASGVRFDLALTDPSYVRTLVSEFTGGQLKLAPEHICDHVLQLMRKTHFNAFKEFLTVFESESQEAGKEQYIVPYFMSAFPGCKDSDMRSLSRWLKSRGWKPRQVQCFIPTPGTVATAMYYSGKDPDGNPIYVARSDAQRLRQHQILIPKNGKKNRKARQGK